MKHICIDKKTYEVVDGKHERCGAVLLSGKPGKAHVCGQDDSTCAVCEAKAGHPRVES